MTASDCRWDYYRGTGKGGQKRNKTSNCVRCTHYASGAVGKSEDGRSQRHNRETAFKRMSETDVFKKWLRIESARHMGTLTDIDKATAQHTVVEVRKHGMWVKEDTIGE